MPGEPIAQDGDSVDGPAAVEMDLQFVCSGAVVYLGFENKVISSEVYKEEEAITMG